MEDFKKYGSWSVTAGVFGERNDDGYITYSKEDGVYLDLGRMFLNLPHSNFTKFPIIHGCCSHDGFENITLFNCRPTNLPGTKYKAEFATVGAHFESEEDIEVNTITLESSAIKYVFVKENVVIKDENGIKNISHVLSEDIVAKVENVGKIVLRPRCILKSNRHAFSVLLEQELDLEVCFDLPVTLNKAQKVLATVLGYLTFVLQQTPDISDVKLSTSKGCVTWLFAIRKGILQDKIPYDKTRFYWVEDQKSFEGSISRWFIMNEKISPSLRLLFDTYLPDYTLSENSFLNMAQALELFHRQYYPIKESEIEGFYQKVNRILGGIVNEADRKHIKGIIGPYAHEKSLRKRIKECLVELKGTDIPDRIGGDKNFINKIVNNRNYYTHYDPKSTTVAVDLEILNRLTAKLKVILVGLLLKKLGYKDEFINKLIKSGKFPWTLLAFHDARYNVNKEGK